MLSVLRPVDIASSIAAGRVPSHNAQFSIRMSPTRNRRCGKASKAPGRAYLRMDKTEP